MNRSTILANTFWITAILALSVSAAQASTICVGYCDVPPPTPISVIVANTSISVNLGSSLLSGVSQTNNGWTYFYNVMNRGLSPVNSFTLPYFTDEQISTVKNPTGWGFETGNIDVFGLGQGAGYMRWTYIGTPPIDVNPGFSFLSLWAPGLAAYNYTQIDQTSHDGTGTSLPLSTLALTYGLVATPTAIPVPPALIPFLTALAALTLAARHSKGGVI